MSTTIRVSDETKSMLSVIKDDEESWDEFLARLARRERDVEELSGFAEDGIVEHIDSVDRALSGSFQEREEERPET